jgi:ABC-type sugar transport system ATPase subunit
MADISFRRVTKSFASVTVIPELDLIVNSGEFTVLLGPSGCGKTTLLRMVAGLETPTSGEIWIGSREVTDLRPSERDIAMVFQSYALYPHLTVADNLAFPLRVQGVSKDERTHQVQRVSALLGLGKLLDRKPRQLSGGQRQRVALGRAMVREPGVFLFDEPLSNLDASMREEMRSELIRFHDQQRKTIIYVTHDQVEAMTMAERIVVMRDGVIQQIGSPRDIYREPANTFVARFIGSPGMNLLDARITGADLLIGGAKAEFVGAVTTPKEPGFVLGCRPEDIRIGETVESGVRFFVTVLSLQPLGASVLVDLQTADGGTRLVATAAWDDKLPNPGDQIAAFAPAGRISWFNAENGARLVPAVTAQSK